MKMSNSDMIKTQNVHKSNMISLWSGERIKWLRWIKKQCSVVLLWGGVYLLGVFRCSCTVVIGFRPWHEFARRRYWTRGEGVGVARSITGPRSITSVKLQQKRDLIRIFQALPENATSTCQCKVLSVVTPLKHDLFFYTRNDSKGRPWINDSHVKRNQ